MYVRKITEQIARICPAEIFNPNKEKRIFFVLNEGIITAVNFENATATAAIVPV